MEQDYQHRLGNRLRQIRQQQGLTLQQVEEVSGGRWKAVVVGSYERGDRAVSVSKLADLAEFYNVPVSSLLPEEEGGVTTQVDDTIVLDLRQLAASPNPDLAALARFAKTIQLQRGDYNGHVLTIRGADLQALSVLFGTEPQDLVIRLDDEGVLAEH